MRSQLPCTKANKSKLACDPSCHAQCAGHQLAENPSATGSRVKTTQMLPMGKVSRTLLGSMGTLVRKHHIRCNVTLMSEPGAATSSTVDVTSDDNTARM